MERRGNSPLCFVLNKKSKKGEKVVDKGRKRCYISKAVCGTPRVKEKTSKKKQKRLDKWLRMW